MRQSFSQLIGQLLSWQICGERNVIFWPMNPTSPTAQTVKCMFVLSQAFQYRGKGGGGGSRFSPKLHKSTRQVALCFSTLLFIVTEDAFLAENSIKLQALGREQPTTLCHALITLQNLLFTLYILLNYGDFNLGKFKTLHRV